MKKPPMEIVLVGDVWQLRVVGKPGLYTDVPKPPAVSNIESPKDQAAVVEWLWHEYVHSSNKTWAQFCRLAVTEEYQTKIAPSIEACMAALVRDDFSLVMKRVQEGIASPDEEQIAFEAQKPRGRGRPKKHPRERLYYSTEPLTLKGKKNAVQGVLKYWELMAEEGVPWIEGVWASAQYDVPLKQSQAIELFCLLHGPGSVEEGCDEEILNRVENHLRAGRSRRLLPSQQRMPKAKPRNWR